MSNEPSGKPDDAKGQGPELGKEAAKIGKEAGAAAKGGVKEALALAKEFSLGTIVGELKAQVGNPMGFVETAKGTLADPAGFYAKVKPENPNKAVAFLLIMVAVFAVFSFLTMLLHLMIVPAIVSLVLAVVLVPIFTAVSVLVIHILLKLFGAKGGVVDTLKIACYASWVGVISAFPLWGFLGVTVPVLVACAFLALTAWLWIQGAVQLHEMPMIKAAIPIGALAGIFILILLVRLFTALAALHTLSMSSP